VNIGGEPGPERVPFEPLKGGRVLQAFVFESVAVLVGPWHEPVDPPERGTRVELRLLVPEPRRGSESAAQRVVIDQPVFRADLFDLVDQPPGNLASAHFHDSFEGVEPNDRLWSGEIKRDPAGWLAGELNDLGRLLARAGVEVPDAEGVERDTVAVRDAIPAIVAAVNATWDAVRTGP
jgi:hypothetical protein